MFKNLSVHHAKPAASADDSGGKHGLDGAKAGAGAGTGAGSKAASKTGSKGGAKAGAKAETKGGAKTGTKEGTKPGGKTGTKAGVKTGTKTVVKAAAKTGTKAGVKAGTKVRNKTATKEGTSAKGAKGAIKVGLGLKLALKSSKVHKSDKGEVEDVSSLQTGTKSAANTELTPSEDSEERMPLRGPLAAIHEESEEEDPPLESRGGEKAAVDGADKSGHGKHDRNAPEGLHVGLTGSAEDVGGSPESPGGGSGDDGPATADAAAVSDLEQEEEEDDEEDAVDDEEGTEDDECEGDVDEDVEEDAEKTEEEVIDDGEEEVIDQREEEVTEQGEEEEGKIEAPMAAPLAMSSGVSGEGIKLTSAVSLTPGAQEEPRGEGITAAPPRGGVKPLPESRGGHPGEGAPTEYPTLVGSGSPGRGAAATGGQGTQRGMPGTRLSSCEEHKQVHSPSVSVEGPEDAQGRGSSLEEGHGGRASPRGGASEGAPVAESRCQAGLEGATSVGSTSVGCMAGLDSSKDGLDPHRPEGAAAIAGATEDVPTEAAAWGPPFLGKDPLAGVASVPYHVSLEMQHSRTHDGSFQSPRQGARAAGPSPLGEDPHLSPASCHRHTLSETLRSHSHHGPLHDSPGLGARAVGPSLLGKEPYSSSASSPNDLHLAVIGLHSGQRSHSEIPSSLGGHAMGPRPAGEDSLWRSTSSTYHKLLEMGAHAMGPRPPREDSLLSSTSSSYEAQLGTVGTRSHDGSLSEAHGPSLEAELASKEGELRLWRGRFEQAELALVVLRESMREEAESAAAQLATARAENEALAMQVRAKEQQLEAKEQQLCIKDMQLEQAEAAAAEGGGRGGMQGLAWSIGEQGQVVALRGENEQLKERVRELQAQGAIVAEARAESGGLTEKVGALQEENAELTERVRELQGQGVLLEEVRAESRALMTQVEALREENVQLRERVKELQGQGELLAEVRAEGAGLMEKVGALQEENAQLTERVKELQSQGALLAEARAECRELMQQVEVLRKEREALAPLEAENQRLQESVAALTAQLQLQAPGPLPPPTSEPAGVDSARPGEGSAEATTAAVENQRLREEVVRLTAELQAHPSTDSASSEAGGPEEGVEKKQIDETEADGSAQLKAGLGASRGASSSTGVRRSASAGENGSASVAASRSASSGAVAGVRASGSAGVTPSSSPRLSSSAVTAAAVGAAVAAAAREASAMRMRHGLAKRSALMKAGGSRNKPSADGDASASGLESAPETHLDVEVDVLSGHVQETQVSGALLSSQSQVEALRQKLANAEEEAALLEARLGAAGRQKAELEDKLKMAIAHAIKADEAANQVMALQKEVQLLQAELEALRESNVESGNRAEEAERGPVTWDWLGLSMAGGKDVESQELMGKLETAQKQVREVKDAMTKEVVAQALEMHDLFVENMTLKEELERVHEELKQLEVKREYGGSTLS